MVSWLSETNALLYLNNLNVIVFIITMQQCASNCFCSVNIVCGVSIICSHSIVVSFYLASICSGDK